MNELSLFTGIGGGLLGSSLIGWRTICAVEKEPYCREVLLRRQRDGLLPLFPIWDDIRTFDGRPFNGVVDIVSAGFPCQPFSCAGKRLGENDERNMWPETIRVIREVRPRFALLENVPGLLTTRYFGRILGDVAESGYDAKWDIVSAAEVGAPHIRKRLWILLADSESPTNWGLPFREATEVAKFRVGCENVAYTTCQRCREKREFRRDKPSEWSCGCGEENGRSDEFSGWWEAEPSVGRVAHGISNRVDQLRGIGNGQVPRVVEKAWEILSK